ncbi:PTS sugar transporter subunit IIC [Photobacterium angustum]|uniref:Permease IIC component n=1 Tax=Photobacterium angustum TaxID=661 RepID=A0A855SA59_PHOAN|nr:PTS transporter subunit EIIC [Photobacterium angustum]KJF81599.1 cytochrome C biogenesis protein CcmF [Photobacterium damselae subsp. damselae]KJG30932.1 cytochrome C biogenesis protein CcmF [Photobacterium angustum]KJG40851.1 cytochrome C biogenesis protein CcmF [Photobacterium angustum]KJG45245.1 cytochrome C biogenesis protein CcmF [Photobacterium angustum]KJG48756.1 cytochrome C biogenesis protein CcmF [Photobacterium angustum]
MSLINSIMSFVEGVVAPIAGRVANQKHICAIKDGFISTMPFLIVGSLLLVLANPPGTGNWFLDAWNSALHFVGRNNIVAPYFVSMGIFAMYSAYGIAYNLAESLNTKGVNPMNSGMLSMFSFLLAVAPAVSAGDIGTVIPMTYLGGAGAFTAIICGLFIPTLQTFLVEKNIRIKMPEAVPEKISASFDLLIPVVVMSFILGVINVVLGHFGLNIATAIMALFSPLVAASDTYFAFVLAILLIQLLWFAGIHGSSVVLGVIGPLLLINLGANQEALEAGKALPDIFTNPAMDFFVSIGGSGGTLALVVLMARSKSAHLRAIGKMSLIPGCFNINEPVIFGTPIVMNPTFFIPWIASPLVNATIVWSSFRFNIISRVIALPPWTMPAPFGSVMATNSMLAAVVVAVCFIVSGLIFYPFFKMYEKELIKQEEPELLSEDDVSLSPARVN